MNTFDASRSAAPPLAGACLAAIEREEALRRERAARADAAVSVTLRRAGERRVAVADVFDRYARRASLIDDTSAAGIRYPR